MKIYLQWSRLKKTLNKIKMNGAESYTSVNLPRWSHSCVYIGCSKFKRFGNMLTHTYYLTFRKDAHPKPLKYF